MSIFSKIGGFLRKAAPALLGFGASFIPGVGPALSGAIGGLSSAFSGSPASNPSTPSGPDSAPEQLSGPADPPAQQVIVQGQSPPSTFPSYLPAIGSAAAGALNYYGQQSTNSANAAQALNQQQFQQQQTSTSYQRGVKDMEAAGLNPMLAYSQGGASSGSGASAVMGNALGAGANSAVSSAQTLLGLKNLQSQNDNIQAQTGLTDSQTALNSLRGAQIQAETHQSTSSARNLEQQTTNAQSALDGIVLSNRLAGGTLESNVSRAAAESRRSEAEASLSALGIPRARNEAAAEGSSFKREVSPYLGDLGRIVNSALSGSRLGAGRR